MTTANNNQPVSIEDLFVELTPEDAQNISGGWKWFNKTVKKIEKEVNYWDDALVVDKASNDGSGKRTFTSYWKNESVFS